MSIVDYVSGLPKPDCAPMIDGVYLEDLVPGYRTLSATGREPLDIDITTVSLDKLDGERYRWKRLQPRDITINYAITTDTLTAYHNSYNKLKQYLYNRTNSKYIFNDEDDKYIVGTVSGLTETSIDATSSGGYAANGEITVHCSDPIKYSVKEYTVTSGSDGIVRFNYDGTYPSYPTISVKANAANTNYIDRVTIVNQDGNVLTFGESRTISNNYSYATPYRCMNYGNDYSNGTTGDSLNDLLSKGTANSDSNNRWWMSNGYEGSSQGGSIAYKVDGGNPMLYASNFDAAGTNIWQGTCLRWDIGKFPDGSTSTKDFFLKFNSVLISQDRMQTGGHYIGVEDENGEQIMGMWIVKNNDTNDRYSVFYYVGNTSVAQMQAWAAGPPRYDADNVSSGKGQRGWHSQHSLQKSGNQLIFHFASPTAYDGTSLASHKAKYVVLAFTKLHDPWLAMSINGLEYLRFEGNYARNVTVNKTIVTYFTTNDTLTTDCSDGSVTVNGMLKPGMSALGNDWSKFALQPGNACYIAGKMTGLTDGVDMVWDYKVTVKYRKAYL